MGKGFVSIFWFSSWPQRRSMNNLRLLLLLLRQLTQNKNSSSHQMSALSSHIETYFPRCRNEQKILTIAHQLQLLLFDAVQHSKVHFFNHEIVKHGQLQQLLLLLLIPFPTKIKALLKAKTSFSKQVSTKKVAETAHNYPHMRSQIIGQRASLGLLCTNFWETIFSLLRRTYPQGEKIQ